MAELPRTRRRCVRVFRAFIAAKGPLGVAVHQADWIGRVSGAVAAATRPDSPGGSRVTIGEAAAMIVVGTT